MAVIDIYDTSRRYAIIYADPPWEYRDRLDGNSRMRGRLPYPSMKIEDIAALPVADLSRDDAELWCWTTNPFIHEALHIVEAWGFTYKTMQTWAKPKPGLQGIGHWLIGQTEQLLFATRGQPRPRRRNGLGPPSTLLTTRNRLPHSRKPREVYEEIERLAGTPRLELFARRPRKGWDAWGLDAHGEDVGLRADMETAL